MEVEQYYSIMGVEKIIYIEDDIKSRETWNSILRDFLMLNENRQTEIASEIEDKNLQNLLQEFSKSIPADFDLGKCPQDGIKAELKEKACEASLELLEKIEEIDIHKWSKNLLRYGLGVNPRTVHITNLLFAQKEDATYIPCAIISDWQNEDVQFFEKEVNKVGNNGGSFICIIDDQIRRANRAEEIITYIINNLGEYRDNGIYMVLSSKANPVLGTIGDDIYIEHIQKSSDKESNKKAAVNALLKSCYSSLLKHYKETRISAISKAFSCSRNNMNTAIFIANMARHEGTTGYESIRNWIELYEQYEFENSFDMIEKMTELSWAISNVSMEAYIPSQVEARKELNSFINFDKNINKKYSAIQPGDIFFIKNELFILVGQSCDLMLRGDGDRKESVARLLKAEMVNQPVKPTLSGGKMPWRTVIIDNYDELHSIVVYCDDSRLIDIRILDLCSFNENGVAELVLNSRSSVKKQALLTEGQYNCEVSIANSFKDIQAFTEDSAELCKTLCNQKQPLTIFDYEFENDKISFPVTRIARIKRYAQLLHRLNLEHTERLGFEVLNTGYTEETEIDVFIMDRSKTSVKCIMQYTTDKNMNSKYHRLKWYILCKDIEDLIKEAELESNIFFKVDKYYLFESDSNKGFIGEGRYRWEKKFKESEKSLTIIKV